MKIAILGYGKQGASAYHYFNRNDNQITVCDGGNGENIPKNISKRLGANYLVDLHEFDIIVRSPSIHPNQIRTANPDHPEVMEKVTSNTNEFFKVCPAPIIGVTGTKGKGTTSTLIYEILKAAGYRAHLGGNIGIPPLDMLKENIKQNDIVVLELANFQLIDLKYSPKTSVCLGVYPEHLDWHKDIYEYIHAKQQMFAHQTHEDIAIYNARNEFSEEVASASHGKKLAFEVPDYGQPPTLNADVYVDREKIMFGDTVVCSINDVALIGWHNLQNVCAAIAATWYLIKQDKKVIKQVLSSIAGLPNRLEPVRELNGIAYINDSFSSGPESTIAAITAVTKPKVLIIGGKDRMLDLSRLCETIKLYEKQIKKIILIGESAERVASNLEAKGFSNFVVSKEKTIKDIVYLANNNAQSGDAIVLSPGFPSFDMFKDFEDRGNQFRAVVKAL